MVKKGQVWSNRSSINADGPWELHWTVQILKVDGPKDRNWTTKKDQTGRSQGMKEEGPKHSSTVSRKTV